MNVHRLAAAVLLVASACSTDASELPVRGPMSFGDRCTKTEDCSSLLCIRVDTAEQ